MARTAGSISLVSVKYQDVVRLVSGDELADKVNPNIFMDISLKWYQSLFNPNCEMVLVSANDLANPMVVVRPDGEQVKPIEMTRAVAPVETLARCAPKEFSLDDEGENDDSLGE